MPTRAFDSFLANAGSQPELGPGSIESDKKRKTLRATNVEGSSLTASCMTCDLLILISQAIMLAMIGASHLEAMRSAETSVAAAIALTCRV